MDLALSWSVVDVDEWASAEKEEPLGTKNKFWVTDPDERRWLFKYARVRDGSVRGEDWSEWVVHHLAELIGVPTVEIQPATCGDKRGIVSLSVVPEQHSLVHGNELLARVDPSYNPAETRQNDRYTPAAVRHALAEARAPIGRGDVDSFTAFDVWAGYTLLDAWIAGRDRHHENWAVVTGGKQEWLYPSFDHGNALGFQETEHRREQCVSDPERLRAWCRKGRSHHFAGRPTLVAVAEEALSLAGDQARAYWLGRLADLPRSTLCDVLDAVPATILSDLGRRFCVRLLEENRRRLLDGDRDAAP